MPKDKIYIYQIYFPISDKSYIGQTDNLDRRFKQHLDGEYLIGNAMRKYDDWYKNISVLHTCKSRDEASRIEIEEIRNHNSVAPNGYNLTHGGEGGDIFTNNPNKEEIRAKISKAALGNKNADGNQNAKGHKHTEETLEKLRQASLKENLSPETLEKRRQGLLGNQYAKGHEHSAETLNKMSKAKLGNQNAKGCKQSAETIEKHRQGMLGKQNAKGYKPSEEVIAKRLLTMYKNKVVKLEQELAEG